MTNDTMATTVGPGAAVARRLRVLVLEDNPSDAELMMAELGRVGFRPQWTRVQTRDAFEAALDARIDVILADYHLPQFSAPQALAMLTARGLDVPFIVVTGAVGEEAAAECLREGAVDYLLKDRMARLGAAVGRALAGRALREEARRTQKALRESELRYRRLFESAKDAIFIVDVATGRIVDANPVALAIAGLDRHECIGQRLDAVGAFGSSDAWRQAIHDFDGRDYVRVPHLAVVGADGRTLDVELTANVYDVDGERVMQCELRDTTDQRRAEEALAERERYYRQLIENSSDVTTVLDTGGAIVYQSPSGARVSGYTADEMLGRSAFEHVDPGDVARLQALLARALESPGETVFADFRFRNRDGSWRDVEAVATPLLRQSAITGIVVNSREVTARKQLEEQLRQAQKMEAIGRLAGGVAHDFNNLLTAILGYSSLLLDVLPEDDPSRQDIAEIRRAAESGAALTARLLAFSRRQVIQPSELDLNTVITDMDKLLARTLGEDVRLVTDLDPALGHTRADRGQIEQVLLNLAVNARDAMPHGGVLTIRTCNVDLLSPVTHGPCRIAPGHYVRASVTDTGAGMTPEVISHLFEPFFTTKPRGRGTGLGLATVYGIVTMSGGQLGVETAVGRGTTMFVYLPVSAGQVEAPLAEVGPARTDGTEHILLVEDNEAILALAVRVLRSHGYQVVTARNGMEALEVSREAGAFDLLVTDVVMPGMSGVELARRLKTERPTLAVVFTSGYNEEALLRHGVEERTASLLQKPFTPDTLLRYVRQALRQPVPHA